MVFKKGHPQYNSGRTRFKKGCKLTEETKAKLRKSLLGHKVSKKTRLKISKAQKNKKLSEEHKSKLKKAWIKRKIEGKYNKFCSEETRKKVSLANKGKKHSEATKQRISLKHKGKHFSPKTEFKKGRKESEESKLKRMKIHPMQGETHWCWKGGITPINQKIRRSLEYRLWREAVFKRDNWTCVWCGQRGGTLHADHIKPFALFPELRFSIDNGRTLCKSCHLKTDTWGGKSRL